MDATSSSTKHSLLTRLRHDHPQFIFRSDEIFRWAPNEQIIYYTPSALRASSGKWELLHELSHALLAHATYTHDVMLLQMEAQAWEKALEIAQTYGISIDRAHIDTNLATYREWLAKRATCPTCGHNGVQKNKSTYQCINCRCSWRVNDAKFCLLRRYRLDKTSS